MVVHSPVHSEYMYGLFTDATQYTCPDTVAIINCITRSIPTATMWRSCKTSSAAVGVVWFTRLSYDQGVSSLR